VQALGGPREILLFRDGDEITQVTQLHIYLLSIETIPKQCWTWGVTGNIVHIPAHIIQIKYDTQHRTILADVPTIRAHKMSVATMKSQTLVLVRVRCADGIEGWGEATTIGGLNYGEESPESIKTNIDTHIAPLLVGMEASGVAMAMAKVRKTIQATALPNARSRQPCSMRRASAWVCR